MDKKNMIKIFVLLSSCYSKTEALGFSYSRVLIIDFYIKELKFNKNDVL